MKSVISPHLLRSFASSIFADTRVVWGDTVPEPFHVRATLSVAYMNSQANDSQDLLCMIDFLSEADYSLKARGKLVTWGGIRRALPELIRPNYHPAIVDLAYRSVVAIAECGEWEMVCEVVRQAAN